MKKDISKTTKIILASSILGLTILICGLILFQIFINKKIETVTTLALRMQDFEDETSKINVRRAIDRVRLYNKNLDIFLADKEKAVDFIEQIEGIGRRSGVELTIGELKRQTKEESKEGANISFLANAKGNWKQISNFIEMVESIPKEVRISSVEMDGSLDFWSARIRIITLTN